MKNDAANPIYEGSNVYQFGLTKREAFAMAAMQGFCADGSMNPSKIPDAAVKVADALLAELEAKHD